MGIKIDIGAYSVAVPSAEAQLDAANNYWNCADGPSGAGFDTRSSGDAIIDESRPSTVVIAEPFLRTAVAPPSIDKELAECRQRLTEAVAHNHAVRAKLNAFFKGQTVLD